MKSKFLMLLVKVCMIPDCGSKYFSKNNLARERLSQNFTQNYGLGSRMRRTEEE